MSTPRFVITLVHGTFARGAKWTQENSSFIQQIDGHLSQKAIFRSFEWSGENSHPARLQAGEQLAIQLNKQLKDFPHLGHFVIAHSHGGNVALYAKNNWRMSAETLGLVTLGTPFIGCRPRQVDRLMETFTSVLEILIILVWIGSASLIVSWAVTFFRGEGIIAGAGCIVLFLFLRLNYSLGVCLNNIKKNLDTWLVNWAHSRQQKTARKINSRVSTRLSVLSIIVTDDEARRWLTLLRLLGNVIPTLSRPLMWFVTTSVYLCKILLLGVIVAGMFLIWSGDEFRLIAFIVNVLLLTILAVAISTYGLFCSLLFVSIMLQKIIRSHRFGFGGESVIDNLFSDIFITETPSGMISETFTTVGTEGGLHHSSFFGSPRVNQVIAEWINK